MLGQSKGDGSIFQASFDLIAFCGTKLYIDQIKQPEFSVILRQRPGRIRLSLL